MEKYILSCTLHLYLTIDEKEITRDVDRKINKQIFANAYLEYYTRLSARVFFVPFVSIDFNNTFAPCRKCLWNGNCFFLSRIGKFLLL